MIQSLLVIALGIIFVFTAERQARAVRKRMFEGTDSFFEEQRAHRAYPALRDPKWIRRAGLVLILLGIVVLVLNLYAPR